MIENIEEARQLWIETAYESDKREIPLPMVEQEYSGKFVLRIPKSLHRRLAEAAQADGVSLNQYTRAALSKPLSKVHSGRLMLRVLGDRAAWQVCSCLSRE